MNKNSQSHLINITKPVFISIYLLCTCNAFNYKGSDGVISSYANTTIIDKFVKDVSLLESASFLVKLSENFLCIEIQVLQNNNIFTLFFPFNFQRDIPIVFDLIQKSWNISTQQEEMNGIFLIFWPNVMPSRNYTDHIQEIENFIQRNSQESLFLRIPLDKEVFIVSSFSLEKDIVHLSVFELYCIEKLQPILEQVSTLYFSNFKLENLIGEIQNFMHSLVPLARRRSNFRGVVLNVVAQNDVNYKTSVDLLVLENSTVVFKSGYCINILADYQKMLNFSYNAIAGKGWTTQVPNSLELAGIGKQVMDDEAHLCVSTSTMIEYRLKHLKFLPSVIYFQGWVYYREISRSSTENIFTSPFDSKLWYFLTIIWILLLFTIILFNSYAPNNTVKNGSERFSLWSILSDSLFAVISISSLQGWSSNPMNLQLRLIFFITAFTSFLVYVFYTGAFVASISHPSSPIQSFKDLEKLNFDIFTHPEQMYSAFDFVVGEKNWAKLLETSKRLYKNGLDSLLQILDKERKVAFIAPEEGIFQAALQNNVSERELCKISKIYKVNGVRLKDGMFLKKGSPFIEPFRHRTTILIENGLNSRYIQNSDWESQVHCLQSESRGVQLPQLSMREFSIAFKILTCGVILCLIIFCIEIFQDQFDGKKV